MNTIIYTLVMVQLTIACVTLYLHRSQAHKAVTFHPVVAHAMRFWLWMTTGMVTKQWVAIHRKHHRFDDAEGDPHSPHVFGIWNIFLRGVYYYYLSAKDARMTLSYGAGTPDDWMERKIYSKYNYVGVGIMLAIDILFFGWWGPLVWAAQMLWIPFWAAGVVNGIGHWWGYRNTDTKDFSRNIVPWDFWVGGELLHNNHHADPASPKLSLKWYEFDIGWMYIQLLRLVGLAKIRVSNSV
jgi:stearoyl-CoA desaturase (delta-9 desaturase)